MTDRAFERYKDALRRGHVAALRGALDEAVEAYREAGTIAPDRAIPFTSLASVLRRLGRDEDALAAYGKALERSPSDVIALLGRAELFASLEQWVMAAEAYLALAELHASEGRAADAADVAQRAIDLVDQPERRSSMGRLVGRFRGTETDPALAPIVERAQALLVSAPAPAVSPVSTSAMPGGNGRTSDAIHRGDALEVPGASDESTAGSSDATGIDGAPTPAGSAEPGDAEQAAIPPEGANPLALILAAERATDRGDAASAVEAYRAAASNLSADHRWRVALDACAQALAIAPTDPRLHLDMAEVYLAAGWTSLAADKLRLVARLADLDDDATTAERVCSIVRVWLADDPELAALCP